MAIKELGKEALDFLKSNALHLVTLFNQEKGTTEIKDQLKEKFDLPEGVAEAVTGIIQDLKKAGFDDEVFHLDASIEFNLDDFADYGLFLNWLRETKDIDPHNNHIWCMATISNKKLRLRIIHKFVKAARKADGTLDYEKLYKLFNGYGTISDPKDSFVIQLDKVDQVIENTEKEVMKLAKNLHKKEKRVRSALKKWNSKRFF